MEPSVVCRDYRDGDFPGIQALWEVTGLGGAHRGDTAALVEATLRHGGCFLILEEPDGRIVGTSWLTSDARRVYLHHFGILPDRQGQKLGRLLLDETMARVAERGLQVKLEVHKDNGRAQMLYRSAGFKPLGDYDVLIIR
jgi:ribosomal protein S18 acetylase RimI-like enzyme